jgi:hypothetical protein
MAIEIVAKTQNDVEVLKGYFVGPYMNG